MRTIRELMRVAADLHDVVWLREALQNAVQLELATLPPYLTGMWSIKDGESDVYDLIRTVTIEEMLHMGLAANMLNSIGGNTVINSEVPTYPGQLPGDVRPELIVYLGGLTPGDDGNVKNVFMEIEYPEGGPIAKFMVEDYPTIGAFYNAIEAAFEKLPPEAITGQRQIVTSIGSYNIFAINNLEDAINAIQIIIEQGEGTPTSPDVPTLPDEPNAPREEFAHYYKFAEIYNGRQLIENPPGSGKWSYTGNPVPFPETYPMAVVPPGGYPIVSKTFDQQYSQMLDFLQEAWKTGGSSGMMQLRYAINLMFSLKSAAQDLMQMPIDANDPSKGNYGPSFLYVN